MKHFSNIKLGNNKKLLIAIATLMVFLAISIIVAVWMRDDKKSVTSSDTPTAFVDITDQGFIPAELVIVKGTTVQWTNKTANPHQIAANPYPTRDELPELYSDLTIPETGTFAFTFTEVGETGYHDPLKLELSGRITVIE